MQCFKTGGGDDGGAVIHSQQPKAPPKQYAGSIPQSSELVGPPPAYAPTGRPRVPPAPPMGHQGIYKDGSAYTSNTSGGAVVGHMENASQMEVHVKTVEEDNTDYGQV